MSINRTAVVRMSLILNLERAEKDSCGEVLALVTEENGGNSC